MSERKEFIVESDAEKALWNNINKRVDIRVIYHDAKDGDDEDCLILRLESPQDDPEILKEYPDSVIGWQSIRLDVFAVIDLRRILNDWIDAG